jgi:hypothetical protein
MFGSAELDPNITDPKLTSNVMWSFQAGLSIWKDFRFLFDVFIDMKEIENNPISLLAKISGQLGYKNALVVYKQHKTSGSYLWVTENGASLPNRSDFSIEVNSLSLQYDVSSFFKDELSSYFEEDLGGWYLGLAYMSYDGISKRKEGGILVPTHDVYHGFGISVGIDTLTGYLQNSFNPFLFWEFEVENLNSFFMPWVKLGWELTLGQDTSTTSDGHSSTQFVGLGIIDLVIGAAYVYKTDFADMTFSAGYNPTFYTGFVGILHNEGLIVRASLKF